MADLDHCPACAGVRLVRRLGEAECKDCGWVRPPVAPALPGHLAVLAGTGPVAAAGSEPDAMQELAAEVEQALARVLGRTAGSAAGG
jgi:hypothetical protein